MHGDEPGTDLDTVNGEPVRQQGQQGFGDQEQCRLRGIWFPLYEHPCSFSHQAPPSLRKGLGKFGITEIERPCLNDPACRADPQGIIANRFFLFDNPHATTAVHTIVGNQIASMFVPEPSGLAISIPGLIALVVMMWRRTT
jgi:hypothetical protein